MNQVEMVMPKMGESIMEGTILKWLKNEGDSIDEDESVLEVATDKVDTEIPSTHNGKLIKILAIEGMTIQVGKPIAIIETNDTIDNQLINEDPIQVADEIFKEALINNSSEKVELKKQIKSESNNFYSPLVLNIANRENISISDLDSIEGTGENQRITKIDLLKFLEEKNIKVSQPNNISENIIEEEEIILNDNEELIETDRVRKIIASRMIESKQISPHVTSFIEADITNVANED